jgi:hypothetical protein
MIVRFTYVYAESGEDASKVWIKRHIDQLKPLLETNNDVIAWFEAGFIGAWGEWHDSTNGNDTDANKREILDYILSHFPADRAVLVRRPQDLIRWYPTSLTAAESHTGTNKARTGHHNDCFHASETDAGTYWDADTFTNKRTEWSNYISQMTQYVPMTGETCAVNSPMTDCSNILPEFARLHWTALSENTPGNFTNWYAQGCLDTINKRLGYRYELDTVKFNEEVKPGGILDMTFIIKNTGWAAMFNKRNVYVTLTSANSNKRVAVPIDLTTYQSGTYTQHVKIRIPSDALGLYRLSLHVPDPSANLANDSRYAVRFANSYIWDDGDGHNVLGEVTVTNSTTGSTEAASNMLLIP